MKDKLVKKNCLNCQYLKTNNFSKLDAKGEHKCEKYETRIAFIAAMFCYCDKFKKK